MNYLKFSKFLYLAFAIFLIYDVFKTWSIDRSRAYLSLFLLAVAIFMFFFRRRFENKGNNSK
ncbi:hypothetical protein [Algibacter sp. Ld11]|uniref:hypothetical protein n=1 Tax=Algibacter sp. Ld11 TaxID=649150 RepID=UPI0038657082